VEGRRPGARLVKVDYVPATSHDSKFLNLPKGSELLRIQRVRTADDMPVFLENSLFPATGFDFLLNGSLDSESMNFLLANELGRSVASYERCKIRVCVADAEMAKLLSIAVGDPLFFEEKDLVDDAGKPIFIAKDYLVGSCFEFEM
jgi:GntR family transcriptional regulator